MDDIYKYYKEIKTRKDFEQFLNLLYIKYKNDSESGKYWENHDLERFLNALYYSNQNTTETQNNEPATWKEFAAILLTAIVYE